MNGPKNQGYLFGAGLRNEVDSYDHDGNAEPAHVGEVEVESERCVWLCQV